MTTLPQQPSDASTELNLILENFVFIQNTQSYVPRLILVLETQARRYGLPWAHLALGISHVPALPVTCLLWEWSCHILASCSPLGSLCSNSREYGSSSFLGCFFFFWLRHGSCWILVPQPGIVLVPPPLEAWNLNHWTAREVPKIHF